MSVTECPHCGRKLDPDEDSIYCEHCGGNITREPQYIDDPNAEILKELKKMNKLLEEMSRKMGNWV